MSKNTIKFYGNASGSTGHLQLETERASLTIKITLRECPPGFLNNGKSCECSESEYEGISNCEGNRSLLVRGFWIGWCKNHTICTGRCPHGYCFYGGNTSERIELPSSMTNLDRFLCGKYSTGVLCNINALMVRLYTTTHIPINVTQTHFVAMVSFFILAQR